MMTVIEDGNTVEIHYTLTVDGEVVDSSLGQDPLKYEQGAGDIIPGLEKALAGLSVGNKKQVQVSMDEGYGPYNTEAVHLVSKEVFPDFEQIEVGMLVDGDNDQGEPFQAVVKEISEEGVMLDFNHPLAGKALHFDVEVISIA